MREIVTGGKKKRQEAQAIKNTDGELVVSSSEIKKVTLQHCLNVLSKNVPEKEVLQVVKDKKELHDILMKDVMSGKFKMTEKDYWQQVTKFKRKGKRSYDFLVKAGPRFQTAIYKLTDRILSKEEIPDIFNKTLLIQLFKGKGDPKDLGNSRFLHMKDWLPRLCEAVVVEGKKEKRVSFSVDTIFFI